MQEEQDTCRICSAPAEPDQPLFYPCKCSGTIRYIHQDCLTTWLAHSKKKTCDVCKHPYSFTKVYSPDMPPRLPLVLLLRRFAQQSAVAVVFAIRAMIVGLIWLAFLPWATIWTWRMYFTMGDSTAWWISNRERPQPNPSNTNATFSISQNDTSSDRTSAGSFLSHPAVRAVSADIVAGQIIATIIVVAFVAIFLLREWISQNARPGIFDDGDAPPEGEPVPEVVIAPEPIPPPAPAQDIPPVEPADIPDEDTNRRPIPDTLRQRRQRRRVIPQDSDSDTEEDREEEHVPRFTLDKGKGKMRRLHTRADAGSSSSVKRRHSWSDTYARPSPSNDPQSIPLDLEPEQQQFTFRADVPRQDPAPNNSEAASTGSVSDAWTMNFSDWDPLSNSDLNDGTSTRQGEFISPSSPLKSPSRPPLFSTAVLTPVEPGTPTIAPNISYSRAVSPLGSPSLATYRAPEELEAGPSNLSGYFQTTVDDGHISGGNEEDGDDYSTYFREPSDDEDMYDSDHALPEDIEIEIDVDANADMPGLESASEGFMDGDENEDEDEDEEENAEVGEDFNRAGEDDAFDEGQEQALDEPPGVDGGDLNDELDVGMEDDMEGALEDVLVAIGLRGPVYAVLQNAALMIFVLSATIGLGVWLPFTVGKSLALLSLEPRRLLYLLDFPIRAIRVVTDPIVDTFMLFLGRAVVPPLTRVMQHCLKSLTQMAALLIGEELSNKSVNTLSTFYQQAAEKWNTPPQTAASSITILDTLLAPDSTFMHYADPYFAPIGQSLRLAWADVQKHWIKLALGNGTTEKIFAILLGYMVDTVLLAIYLNVLTVGSMRSAGRAVRNAVRQQLLVVKVAAFIIVELVVFPLGCGVMLDMCTVSLFPQGSFKTRAEFLLYAPLTSAFYHWVIGTMFMYQFAVLLAGFRSCLRPGALWFIKDPQDQNFHPIREILERPTLVHIRKLVLSGVMYALVVACSVGTISGVLRVFSQTIMPFRWKIREPLSVVPIDLLFLHLVLPYTLQYFKPRKFLRQGGLHVWKFLAAQLRLSSYLFGIRSPSEEILLVRSWFTVWGRPIGVTLDGTYRRVPNSDNIFLIKNEPATVEVDSLGQPIDENAARIIQLQDAETERQRRNVQEDYTVVYLPPHFRYRIIAFTIAVWMICSIALATFLGLPILLGRYFFKLFIHEEVHDGYSFIAGFYLLWACWLVSKAVERMDKHRQRRGADEERADLALYVIKRSLLWVTQAAYMALFLGVVIPTLIALIVELYILLPARHTFHPDLQPRIRIVDMWALGLLFTKIVLRVQRMRPQGRLARGIDTIRRNGWTHLDPLTATKEVILPIVGGLLGMILLPPAMLWAILRVMRLQVDEPLLFLHVYPSIFTFTAGAQGALALAKMIVSWSQTVRDKEFLVEMRLQNLESEQDSKAEPDGDDDTTFGGEDD